MKMNTDLKKLVFSNARGFLDQNLLGQNSDMTVTIPSSA
jgi:hypothetical protein